MGALSKTLFKRFFILVSTSLRSAEITGFLSKQTLLTKSHFGWTASLARATDEALLKLTTEELKAISAEDKSHVCVNMVMA